MEELESFPVDPFDPTRKLQVGNDLTRVPKEALRKFLYRNLDIFTWKHKNMLVDTTLGHELSSIMDTYPGYNQILMYPRDEKHVSFVMDKGLYYYKVMPFGLKSAEATYQKLVNKMLANQLYHGGLRR
ncbi:Ribonuclease H [Abeliophyllum distichum]|uniref:Ribonuclease H n=1 Tax=Abeliophyllum distichum TaxID=126358 RepID=A0ABD1TZG9_9LAMI